MLCWIVSNKVKKSGSGKKKIKTDTVAYESSEGCIEDSEVSHINLYTILLLPLLYGVWHKRERSVGESVYCTMVVQ